MHADILTRIKKLPPDQQEKALLRYTKSMCCSSLKFICKGPLGYKDINERTHQDMIDVLESEHKSKLILMPRGTFKSSIGSVGFPIWHIIRNPNVRILLDGELYTNSKNFLREIQGHLRSEKMTRLFGEFYNPQCWNEGEIIVKQRTKNLKEATITASGIGSEKTGQHYDIIVMDDLNSPTNSNTNEGRQKVIDHFRYNLSILDPGGTLAVIATRYAEMDLPGFIMDNVVELEKEEQGGNDAGGLLRKHDESPTTQHS